MKIFMLLFLLLIAGPVVFAQNDGTGTAIDQLAVQKADVEKSLDLMVQMKMFSPAEVQAAKEQLKKMNDTDFNRLVSEGKKQAKEKMKQEKEQPKKEQNTVPAAAQPPTSAPVAPPANQ
jgi:hypothetical protein